MGPNAIGGQVTYTKAVHKGVVLRYNLPSPLSRVKWATLVCQLAGTMKFSEIPTVSVHLPFAASCTNW